MVSEVVTISEDGLHLSRSICALQETAQDIDNDIFEKKKALLKLQNEIDTLESQKRTLLVTAKSLSEYQVEHQLYTH